MEKKKYSSWVRIDELEKYWLYEKELGSKLTLEEYIIRSQKNIPSRAIIVDDKIILPDNQEVKKVDEK